MCCPSAEQYYILIVIQLNFDMHMERVLTDVLPLMSLSIYRLLVLKTVFTSMMTTTTGNTTATMSHNYCIVM